MKKIMIALIGCCVFLLSCVGCKNDNGNNNDGADVPVIYVVAFETQNGIVKREVERGKALEEIPALPAERGYTFTWSVSDFSCVTKDMTVSLIKTANEYTVYYDLEEVKDAELSVESQKITFGSYLTLAQPRRDCYEFTGWVDEEGKPVSDGVFQLGRDVTLKATWEEDDNWSVRA